VLCWGLGGDLEGMFELRCDVLFGGFAGLLHWLCWWDSCPFLWDLRFIFVPQTNWQYHGPSLTLKFLLFSQ